MAEEYEKQVPVFDFETGDFKLDATGAVVTVTQGEAIEQIAQKAQITARGVYLAYMNLDNEDESNMYGTDIYEVMRAADLLDEARKSEFERAVREAIEFDPWVTEVSDITVTEVPGEVDALEISYMVHHIFGQTLIDGRLTYE